MGTDTRAVRTGRCGRCGSWSDSKVAVPSGRPVRSGQRQEYFRSCPATTLPDDVRRLLDERSDGARRQRDWARADALRDRDRGARLGGRRTARWRLHRAPDPRATAPDDAGSRSTGPATVAASVQVVAEDHPDDLGRFLRGLAAHPPSATWELVVVANAPAFELGADALASVALPVEPRRPARRASASAGPTRGRSACAASRGEVTILLDTSLEPTGDFVDSAARGLRRPAVGIAGGWGVTSGDAREFVEAPPGRGRRGRGLLPRHPPRGAARGRRLRPSLPLLPQRRPRPLSFAVRDAGWRGGADRAAAAATPRAPRLDVAARGRAGSAQQAQLLPLPRPLGRPARPAAPSRPGPMTPRTASWPGPGCDGVGRARPARLAGDHDRSDDLRLARAERRRARARARARPPVEPPSASSFPLALPRARRLRARRAGGRWYRRQSVRGGGSRGGGATETRLGAVPLDAGAARRTDDRGVRRVRRAARSRRRPTARRAPRRPRRGT